MLGSCYALNYRQCQFGKTNWASKIRDILNGYGFGWIWENQSVSDSVAFVSIFSERVKDCEFQRWSSQVCNMPKLRLYCKYKDDKQEELYLSLPIRMRLRRDLARFRTTSHNLEVEMGRHNNVSFEDRLCQLCGRSNIFAVEDEFHVVFHCKSYNDIRHVYIDKLEALRERRPPWSRQIIALILPTGKMLSLGCERLPPHSPPPPTKKKKKEKKKGFSIITCTTIWVC